MTPDEALKKAGDILIGANPDMFGSITFNLQGKRKTVHANVIEKVQVESHGRYIEVDKKESKKYE
jgi:hypothetical protein